MGAEDVERVRAMRGHLGPDFPLMVDANMKWSVDQAVKVARARIEGATVVPMGADFETMPVAPAAMHAASTKRRSSWLYTHTR